METPLQGREESHDLSDIGRNYPGVTQHSYYKPQAKFPKEISHLLPSSGEFWWEALAAKAQSVALQRPLPRIRLLLPTQPPVPLVVENVSMDVDELAGDDYVPPSQPLHASRTGKATEKGGALQKWKGMLLSRAAAMKHHTSSSQQESTSEEEADKDIPLPQYKFKLIKQDNSAIDVCSLARNASQIPCIPVPIVPQKSWGAASC
ncbi:hypothetical protein EI94DRAFT_1708847 [Lactarius quietus]|nr:hypothetical protein EI94DRAFT_1708847 [Lactarius quietus]